jgi:hypothetical protein
LVSASITPARSRYFRNSSFFDSEFCATHDDSPVKNEQPQQIGHPAPSSSDNKDLGKGGRGQRPAMIESRTTAEREETARARRASGRAVERQNELLRRACPARFGWAVNRWLARETKPRTV